MKNKINYFLENINSVLKEINRDHIKVLSEFKEMAKDHENIEKVIAEIWTNEDLSLFEVCNAAIWADLYYKVINKTKDNPPFYKNANIDLSKDTLKEKLEILCYFWSWLWFMG